MATPTKPDADARSLAEVLASARALLVQHEHELAQIEAQALRVRTAAGTQELQPPVAARVTTLTEQIVAQLTEHAQDTASVAAALNVPAGRVHAVMVNLRDALKIHNIGSEVEPRWQHVLGDDCTPAALRALVRRLISDRPFSHRELVIVTGARENRISGIINDLREDPAIRVVNRGTGSKARWEIIPADIRLAPLPLRRASAR